VPECFFPVHLSDICPEGGDIKKKRR